MNKTLVVLALSLGATALEAQHTHPAPPAAPAATSDSAFRGVQQRGGTVMGVDQYTSRHVFASLPDGGSITLQRLEEDSAGTAQIRQHMREIAAQFARGDFSAPFVVHDMIVPGTAVMTARRDQIRYSVADVERGAVLRLVTTDAAARTAIHEFMEFQRQDHRSHH